jgi:predicted esterase
VEVGDLPVGGNLDALGIGEAVEHLPPARVLAHRRLQVDGPHVEQALRRAEADHLSRLTTVLPAGAGRATDDEPVRGPAAGPSGAGRWQAGPMAGRAGGHEASLSARPGPPTAEPLPVGHSTLEAGVGEPAHAYVPARLAPGSAVPLVVMFHGAGGTPQRSLDLVREAADEHGFTVVAPASTASTWDVIAGGWGPDVRRVDQVLTEVFARVAVDPRRIVASGFSDGASYALSLGLANGDLFTHVAAFSPGFVAAPAWEGTPAVFVSHGRGDRVLPIDRTSRRLVPALRQAGYDVRYVELSGGHGVPPEALDAAFGATFT